MGFQYFGITFLSTTHQKLANRPVEGQYRPKEQPVILITPRSQHLAPMQWMNTANTCDAENWTKDYVQTLLCDERGITFY